MYIRFIQMLALIVSFVNPIDRCQITVPFMRYYKIRSCHKSKLPIIAWDYFTAVTDCMKFARERKGLAFNFSPQDTLIKSSSYIRNCHILGCPEIGNTSTLVPDLLFDYYSAYGNLNTTENASCIKSTGLFTIITSKQNYTEAIKACHSLGGDLANILSEIRTNYLAALLNTSLSDWYRAAYVGLDDTKTKNRFVTPLNNLLSCTKFRAWSPGFPHRNTRRKRENCVILSAADRTWRVVNCKIKLAAICEFYPVERRVVNAIDHRRLSCDSIDSQREKSRCLDQQLLYDLYMNSSRMDQCALNNFDTIENI